VSAPHNGRDDVGYHTHFDGLKRRVVVVLLLMVMMLLHFHCFVIIRMNVSTINEVGISFYCHGDNMLLPVLLLVLMLMMFTMLWLVLVVLLLRMLLRMLLMVVLVDRMMMMVLM
jgi:hypothetical protein